VLKIKKFLSHISIRLLGFNILLVFLPLAGLLFLNTYEKQLLKAQEDSMVQQGRLLAASLSNHGVLHNVDVKSILIYLERKTETRLRVIDKNGILIADSSSITADPTKVPVQEYSTQTKSEALSNKQINNKNDWLYDIATLPFRIFRQLFQPPQPVIDKSPFYSQDKPILGPEIIAALEGRYKAVWRLSTGGQRSVTLFCALPIRNQDEIIGAVLTSQSTYKILKNLYEVRLDVFKIILISIMAAIILSFILSGTIARPIRNLRNEAEAIIDRRGRLTRLFTQTKRKDEIGDLTRSLVELTQRLEKHINFIESFAADLSHEFKNPLASIHSAIEVALEADNRKERERFLKMVQRDVRRMERLLSGAREISRIDTSLEEEECKKVKLNILLSQIIEGFKLRNTNINYNLVLPVDSVETYASPERLSQMFENLLDNASSFSPNNGVVEVVLKQNGDRTLITVNDEGPGIPPENIDKIFNRFFSFRSGEGKNSEHLGLGLAVVKAVVEGYSGSISLINREGGGFSITITLPVVKE